MWTTDARRGDPGAGVRADDARRSHRWRLDAERDAWLERPPRAVARRRGATRARPGSPPPLRRGIPVEGGEPAGPRRRLAGAVALSVAAVAGAAAACGSPPAPRAVVLAATLPLSGSESALAAAWQRGYRRAVDEANARGGITVEGSRQGLEVVLAVEDDGGRLAEAERLAEKLLAGGAHLLLATPGFVRMAAQAAVAGRFERPYLVPSSAAPDLLITPRPWVCVAQTAPAADPEGEAYQVARAAVRAVETARSVDARLVTLALRRSSQQAARPNATATASR